MRLIHNFAGTLIVTAYSFLHFDLRAFVLNLLLIFYLHLCACSDLKGANVLLKSVPVTAESSRGFVCKLADFGLSRVLGANRNHVSTNSHGAHQHPSRMIIQMDMHACARACSLCGCP